MSKVTLSSILNNYFSTTKINSNMATIQTAFDNTLSRDGTGPNQMGASLDMNSNKIINLPAPTTATEPMRLAEFMSGAYAGTSNAYTRYPFVATAGQTVFTCAYNSGSVQVYLNGVLLNNSDYTATNNISVTLSVACSLGDLVDIVAFTSFSVANAANLALSNATFTSKAAGSISRPVVDKLSDWVSIKDFGAKGDGVTNDSAAIALALSSGAAVIYCPAGIYLTNTLALPSNIKMYGDGIGNTIFKLNSGQNTNLFYSNSGTYISLEEMTLDGNKAGNSSPAVNSGNGLSCTSSSNVILQNVNFQNCGGNGFMAFAGNNFTATGCGFLNNLANGIYLTTTAIAVDNGPTVARFANCWASGNYYDGFDVDPGSFDVTFASCVSVNNTGAGFVCYGNPQGVFPRRVVFTGCTARGNYLEGFALTSCTDIVMSGFVSYGNGVATNPYRNNGVIILNNSTGQIVLDRIVMTGGTVVGCGGHGIMITSQGASVPRIATVLINGVVIENISAYAAGYDGIYIDSEVDNLQVTGANIRDTRGSMQMAWGILSVAGSTVLNVGGPSTIMAGTSGTISAAATTHYSYDVFDQVNRVMAGDGYFTISYSNMSLASNGAVNIAGGGYSYSGTKVVGAQVTGYGTPTGASRLSNFPGASATLAQTSAQVAQMITDLKAHGLLGT